MVRRTLEKLRSEAGQVGSGAVAAAAIPTAVLGVKVAPKAAALPATGVAIGLLVVLALSCILAGLVMQWQAKRVAARSR